MAEQQKWRCGNRDQQDPCGSVGQPAGKKREDESGQNAGGYAEGQDGKVRGIRQELAAFQGFKELSVNLHAGNTALSVGGRDTVISSRDGRHSDEHGLPPKARRKFRLPGDIQQRDLRDSIAQEEHAERPVAVRSPRGRNHFAANLEVVRRFDNLRAASQPEGLERERPMPLLFGALFQRDLAGDAVARQFVGAIVSQSGSRASKLIARILPAAILEVRHQHQIPDGLHGAA